MAKTEKTLLMILMVGCVIAINYISIQVASYLKIPFFLDTWGTSVGVMAGGFWIGALGGIIYNLIMAKTAWGMEHWVWAFANVAVALVTYYLFKINWIDIKKPGKLLLTGLILGIVVATISSVITFTVFGGVDDAYEGIIPTYDALLESTGSRTVAAIGEKFITIPVDQIVAIFIAAIVFSQLPKKYILTKKHKNS